MVTLVLSPSLTFPLSSLLLLKLSHTAHLPHTYGAIHILFLDTDDTFNQSECVVLTIIGTSLQEVDVTSTLANQRKADQNILPSAFSVTSLRRNPSSTGKSKACLKDFTSDQVAY